MSLAKGDEIRCDRNDLDSAGCCRCYISQDTNLTHRELLYVVVQRILSLL